jgi:hypothetical protein
LVQKRRETYRSLRNALLDPFRTLPILALRVGCFRIALSTDSCAAILCANHGMIVFAPTTNDALQQVPDAGGTSKPLTRFEKGDASQRWPQFLPDGKAVLFAAGPSALNFTTAQVAVQWVGTGERRNVIRGGMNPRYAPSGHLVYGQRGTLMAVPFDPSDWR